MKKQSKTSRIHEHLGAKHPGKHKQSMRARTHESEAEEKHYGHKAEHAIMSHEHHKKQHDHHLKMAKHHAHAMMKFIKHHKKGK